MKKLFYVGIIFCLGILSCNKYSESKLDGIWINETYPNSYTWEFNKETSEFIYEEYVCWEDLAGNCIFMQTFNSNGDYSVRESDYIDIIPVQNDYPFPNDTSFSYQLESDSLFLLGRWHHKQ